MSEPQGWIDIESLVEAAIARHNQAMLKVMMETDKTFRAAAPDRTRLLITLSLIIGACLGCAATIAAYAFHLL